MATQLNKKTQFLLFDMDGTLLDLHFDIYFWCHHLPAQYARKHQISDSAAKTIVFEQLNAMKGSLDWYCLDYWQRKFDLPILTLKKQIKHLIAVHPYVFDFLTTAKQQGKKLWLVTNAHRDSLTLKIKKTNLGHFFERIISSHDYGFAKEQKQFWQCLSKETQLDINKSVFFDDNVAVLNAAKAFGLKTIAISQPNSKQTGQTIDGFVNIKNFSQLTLA